MSSGETTYTNFIVFTVWPDWVSMPTIYHTAGEHDNYYTINAVNNWNILLWKKQNVTIYNADLKYKYLQEFMVRG